jgi:UDP-N-acetylmuramoylalanine--D-glutamate ligase
MTNYSGKKVSIIGAARSGVAAAIELKNRGASVFLSESKAQADWAHQEQIEEIIRLLKQNDIPYELGGHSDKVYDCQILVTSPGVPANSEVLTKVSKRGIKIISELELGYQLCEANAIAITGSNGKTTTTALVGHIFSGTNLNYRVAGNIGTAFVGVVNQLKKGDWAILEVSTFQLEWIEKFRAKVGAVLNITPDHLDRHGTMEIYRGLKLSVFANQDHTDAAVINDDDPNQNDYQPKGEAFKFSLSHRVDNGCFIKKGTLFLNRKGKVQSVIDTAEIGIKGPHNLANACAAVAITAAAGIDVPTIAAGLKSFAGVEHRLERAGLIGGVSFVNDSKATNVDAVYWALQSVPTPIVLIAGGKDKAGDFSTLNELVRKNVKAVVLIGQATDKIAATFAGITQMVRSGSLEEAVAVAYNIAKPSGTVLLSPGCASFDMFDNFEHRGQVFKTTVKELMENQ